MRLRRHFFTAIPTWLSLLVGVILGSVLTSTFTFRLWWCSYDDLSLDRETLSIIKVNERFWTHKNAPNLHQFDDEECLCGAELDNLRRSGQTSGHIPTDPLLKATQKPSKSVATKPTDRTFRPEEFAWRSWFLNPNRSEEHQPNNEVEYLSYEYTLKKQLLVAVITSEENLKFANSIYNTWGLDVSQILFFVGEDCNVSSATGLPVIRLPGIHDVPIHSPEKTFAVMKYIYENYANSFHWFMRTGHDLYVRGEKLEKFLMRFDPSEKLYLGRLAKEKSTTLELLADERICMGGPGVVLSGAALKELAPHLDYCLGAMEQHNQDSDQPWIQDHVELGRCISRTVGIQCSLSAEARAYFVHEKLLFSSRVLESHLDLITYHPISDVAAMETAHRFFRKKEFNMEMQTLQYLESTLNEQCEETSTGCKVSICPNEAGWIESKKCPNAGVVNTMPKSFASLTKNDVVPWEYFDANSIYNDQMTSPMFYLNVHKDKRQELQVVLGKVVQAASTQVGRTVKFKNIINGYVRHNPMRGNEYIVDADFADVRGKTVQTRVHLVRPLANNYIAVPESSQEDLPINMLVPITNVNDRFKQFMTTYENIALKGARKVNLIVSVYGKEDVIFANEVLDTYRNKYPAAVLTTIEGEGTFSRGKALHLAAQSLHPEDLAFLCDVDMDIGPGFFDRCAKNTIHGKRVYYPEFFKLYNLDYVYRSKPKPKNIGIKRTHGHWAYYSFGMLCIYKSDYDAVGGMNTNIIGWGEEDVSLFERVLKRRLEVLRVPDVGLTHRWHEKSCPRSLSEKQYKHCLTSRGENLADRIELASYIYEHGWQIMRNNSTR